MRLATDTGGTFTDLVVEDDDGRLHMYKSSTTPDDPIRGVFDVLKVAAEDMGTTVPDLLGASEHFIHGTTRAINAILTKTTAKTAFLVTAGHPNILLYREGGRPGAFDFTRSFPEPYIPGSLTFEIPERIGMAGEVVAPLDEPAVGAILDRLAEARVEAIAVCLLWSISNPAHELRVGELIAETLPGVPYTLSHQLNPSPREYRRASSTCIDASLKPLMGDYLRRLEQQLVEAGFHGRVFVVTSSGGVLPAATVADAPIHSINSGPSMAPIAGRHYASAAVGAETAVVADTGGTSYDVSLVRRGRIPTTRETWLGQRFLGHMTGFPSVDVKSIGAGGGSIAWIDEGGMLHVGPRSAGAVPGPVSYGRGGTEPTVTDACVVLGYIDPAYFLGGAMPLDRDAAVQSLKSAIVGPLGIDEYRAAEAVLRVATENMVRAIEDITLHQGIDPRTATLVAGGGAGGLNVVAIARRLGCPNAIVPAAGAVLSAAGALMSELSADFAATLFTTTEKFDFSAANELLADLAARCEEFIRGPGAGAVDSSIEFAVEARYPHQVWELEVPLRVRQFGAQEDVDRLRRDFHDVHREVFAIADEESSIEILTWRARARCRLRGQERMELTVPVTEHASRTNAQAYFREVGLVQTRVVGLNKMPVGKRIEGPAIVESPLTTVVIDPGASVERLADGTLVVTP